MSDRTSDRLHAAVRKSRFLRNEAEFLSSRMREIYDHSRALHDAEQARRAEWTCYMENMEALRLGIHRTLRRHWTHGDS